MVSNSVQANLQIPRLGKWLPWIELIPSPLRPLSQPMTIKLIYRLN